ncbi:MAG: hypothetical protein QM500_00475 [Methylococcales bacterium]
MSKIIKTELEELFKSEDSIGIVYKSDEYNDEAAYLPDGNQMGNCTNCAKYVISSVGRGEIYGFLVEHNPITHEMINISGGHDFAIIDERYIVDPWISLYTGHETQTVYDMQLEKDHEKITEIYGNPSNWKHFDQTKSKFTDQSATSSVLNFNSDSLNHYRSHHDLKSPINKTGLK